MEMVTISKEEECSNDVSSDDDNQKNRNECQEVGEKVFSPTVDNEALVKERRYKCNQCDQRFKQRPHLKRHLLTHTGEKRFECEHCGKKSATKSDARVHSRVHTGEKPYECSICDKPFRTKSSLNVHLEIHSGLKPYSCQHCDKAFSGRRGCKNHEAVHSKEKPISAFVAGFEELLSGQRKCLECNKIVSRTGIYNHIRIHTADRPHKCDECDATFIAKSALNAHIYDVHRGGAQANRVTCDLCDKTLSSKSHLQEHMRSHTGEKPFECSYCGKRFAFKNALTFHTRTHTGEKPFHCKFCTKAFTNRSNLTRHEKSHTKENRKFKCDICSKLFTTKPSLASHILIHTEDELQFKCQYCEKKCRTLRLVRLHEMTHTGDMPYKCSICSRPCQNSWTLKAHMASSHSTVRNHECHLCPAAFKTRTGLCRHFRECCQKKARECLIADGLTPEEADEAVAAPERGRGDDPLLRFGQQKQKIPRRPFELKKCAVVLRRVNYLDRAVKNGCRRFRLAVPYGVKPIYD